MVKKTVHRKKSQGHRPAAATKTRTSVKEIERWTCGFDGGLSGTDSSLALVRSGVNGHKLRIIDMHTGAQRSEHSSGGGTKIRAVAWGQLPSADQSNKSTRAKAKHTGTSQTVIALGLQSGQVQLYSPARNAVVKTLEGTHESPIVDVAFGLADSGAVFSLDEAGVVVQWDVAVGSPVKQLKTGVAEARRLLVSSDAQRVVVASHKIEMWDLAKQSKLQAWPGHTSSITSLMWAADETNLVSAAENDRHVQIWDASPTADSAAATARARAVLVIDSDVVYADVSQDGSVLAVGEDGVVYMWHQVAVAHRGGETAGKKGDSKREDIGHTADGVVKIVSTADDSQAIAILLARFSRVSGDEGNVLIIRGSALKPVFETLSLADEDGQFERELVLSREPQDNLLVGAGRTNAEKQLAAQQQQYSEAGASITNPSLEAARQSQKAVDSAVDAQGVPSLAERIKQLSAGPDATPADSTSGHQAVAGAGAGKNLQAGTLIRVLVQSLHTDDQEMLDTVLNNSARTAVVRDTVMGLPTAYVLPFLQQLFARFQSTPARAAELLPWIRNTFAIHSAYLTSIPNLVPQLSGFYQGIESRLETHQRLLKLNGRLELTNMQIRARSHYEKEKEKQDTDNLRQTAMKPLNIYHESDEEDAEETEENEEGVPAWQAGESTDDEELSDGVDNEDDDDQWSDGDEDAEEAGSGSAEEESGSDADSDGEDEGGSDDDLEQFD
ncbi:NUC189-domain-containing protein [Martensiomyces pterosporus]|nr:NUC189-domain-containing protein [Martensiomyces pterosporus]